MKIKKLSEKTINRIAAGEVVERPLSVVKELIENSLDAGAKNITIEIERGGRNLIMVSDDGIGIAKEELSVALERHATSKLNEEDISNINFHGFRGEALPSIASISRMKISSRLKANDNAWQIEVMGGEEHQVMPARLKVGTVIEVRDLFCFTPNRLKFLKSENSEISACIDLVNKFALYHTNVTFKLVSDDKVLLDYKDVQDNLVGDNIRIKDILGAEFASNSIPVDTQKGKVKLQGLISLPTYSRRTSANYLVYVNKRIIKDRFFIGVIKAAYQGLIPHDRYPAVLLFLEIDPYEVDVNVHPTKAEVRFRDEHIIRGFIISTIRNAIADGSMSKGVKVEQILDKNQAVLTPKSIIQEKLRIDSLAHHKPEAFSYNYVQREAQEMWDSSQANFISPPNPASKLGVGIELQSEGNTKANFPLGFAKCQIKNTYIIAETEQGLIIVDQHAAHERLVLEKMKKAILENNIRTQPLLVPEIIDLGSGLTEKILNFSDALKKFGLVIERNGVSQVVIREVPRLFGKFDIRGFVLDFCDSIEEYENASFLNERFDEICGNIACHSSIRAGRKLSIEEMNAILREMEHTPFSEQCNHGRPTFRKISLVELEKMFERS